MLPRNSITSIILHCGLHKTGTSTLQNALSSIREPLKSEGILYPDFQYQGRAISNHSIPYYSMFTEDPVSYHINQRFGLQTPKEIRQAHDSYKNQLLEQLFSFRGNRLMISGEDLSMLKMEELQRMKSFFTEQIGPKASFTILFFIRHPVKYAASMVQEKLKHGSSQENAMKEQIDFSGSGGFRKIFERFEACFGRDCIQVNRFEDALKDDVGLTGFFFKAAGLNPSLADQIPKENMNPSMSMEAATLLAAICSEPNQKYRVDESESNQKNRVVEGEPGSKNRVGENGTEEYKLNLQRLIELPGQKFSLSDDFHQTIWENSLNDIEWICNRYSLQHYHRVEPKPVEPETLWPRKAIHYLFRWIHRQPAAVRQRMLQGLDADVQKNRLYFTKSKRIYLFLMTKCLAVYLLFLRLTEKPLRFVLEKLY